MRFETESIRRRRCLRWSGSSTRRVMITLLRSQSSQIDRTGRENIVILDGVRRESISTMRYGSGGR
jgi:hypothetical protein